MKPVAAAPASQPRDPARRSRRVPIATQNPRRHDPPSPARRRRSPVGRRPPRPRPRYEKRRKKTRRRAQALSLIRVASPRRFCDFDSRIASRVRPHSLDAAGPRENLLEPHGPDAAPRRTHGWHSYLRNTVTSTNPRVRQRPKNCYPSNVTRRRVSAGGRRRASDAPTRNGRRSTPFRWAFSIAYLLTVDSGLVAQDGPLMDSTPFPGGLFRCVS